MQKQDLEKGKDKEILSPEYFETVLKSMLKAMAGSMGEEFLQALVGQIKEVLELDFVMIGRVQNEQKSQVQTLAISQNVNNKEHFKYSLKNSPWQGALTSGVCCVAENASTAFPLDPVIKRFDAAGYISVSLTDSNNQLIGFVTVLAKLPVHNSQIIINMLQVFSYRIASELERQSIIQNLKDEMSVNQAMLDSAPALMFMFDRKGRFLRWNQYYLSKFGFTETDMMKQDALTAVHPNDRKRIEIEIEKVFSSGSANFYLNGLTKGGSIVPLLTTAQLTEYEGKKVIIGVALDMTEQQNVEHNLLRSQGRLAHKNSQLSMINKLVDQLHASHSVQRVADIVLDILKGIENDALILFSQVSSSGEKMQIIASYGVSESILKARATVPFGQAGSPTGLALLSQQLEVFKDIANDDRITPEIKKLIAEDNVKSGLAIPLIYQDEALGAITIGFKYDSIFPEDEIEFFQTIGASISLALANARQFELMENLATHDNLTGLPNRNALNNDSRAAIKENSRNQDCLGLILIDLDRFKEINDTLDHQIGDKLLKLIGPRISGVINDYNARIYRLGGDEFCVLIPRKKKAAQITQISQLIKKAIERVFVIDGLNLEITSSIGVVTTKGDRYNPSEMLRCVELAMYHAKNNGGGIAHYTPELDADTQQRFVIMAEMAEAIRNDDLVLHYQPKYDLKEDKIIGCEALVRWQHKSYGLLPPAKFIPLVELTQLIHPLTYWVMKNAFSQLQKWKEEGLKIDMAINLSTRNLSDNNFIEQVDSLMSEFEIEAHDLEFEVTETAVIGNLDRAIKQLEAFKKRDIKCSLDDYGTGYSSLAYIKKLPLDILKIDRSFITSMQDDESDSIIAKSTIDLAHNLGMKVIAEGVEDKHTMQKLLDQGCDMVQGYYICEPVDADKFAELYWLDK